MMLNDYVGYYLGTNVATNIELDATEYGPGGDKQPMSLVGGLFQDEIIGYIMQKPNSMPSFGGTCTTANRT